MEYKDEGDCKEESIIDDDMDHKRHQCLGDKFFLHDEDPETFFAHIRNVFNAGDPMEMLKLLDEICQRSSVNFWKCDDSFKLYDIPGLLIHLAFEAFQSVPLPLSNRAIWVIANFMDPPSAGFVPYFLEKGLIDFIASFLTNEDYFFEPLIYAIIAITHYSVEAINEIIAKIPLDMIIELVRAHDATEKNKQQDNKWSVRLLQIFEQIDFSECPEEVFVNVLDTCQEFLMRTYSVPDDMKIVVSDTKHLFNLLLKLCTSPERYNAIVHLYDICNVTNMSIREGDKNLVDAALRFITRCTPFFNERYPFHIDYNLLLTKFQFVNKSNQKDISLHILEVIKYMINVSQIEFNIFLNHINAIGIFCDRDVFKILPYSHKKVIFDICTFLARNSDPSRYPEYIEKGMILVFAEGLKFEDDESRIVEACQAIKAMPDDVRTKRKDLVEADVPEIVLDLIEDLELQDETHAALEMLMTDNTLSFLIEYDCPTEPEE